MVERTILIVVHSCADDSISICWFDNGISQSRRQYVNLRVPQNTVISFYAICNGTSVRYGSRRHIECNCVTNRHNESRVQNDGDTETWKRSKTEIFRIWWSYTFSLRISPRSNTCVTLLIVAIVDLSENAKINWKQFTLWYKWKTVLRRLGSCCAPPTTYSLLHFAAAVAAVLCSICLAMHSFFAIQPHACIQVAARLDNGSSHTHTQAAANCCKIISFQCTSD